MKGFTINGRIWQKLSPLLVLIAAFGVYMGNGHSLPSGDTIPGKLLPVSILVQGNLDMDEFASSIFPKTQYCMRNVNGRMLSSYPLGPAFTALPIYTIAYLTMPHVFGSNEREYLAARLGEDNDNAASHLEDLSAAVIAAFSVMLIWLICRSSLSLMSSLLVTAGYALGTPIMSSASQALWTHGPSCLALTLMLYGLLKKDAGRILLFIAGAAAGWAVFCRPTDALPLVVLGPWIIWNCRKRAMWFALGALLIFGITSALNYSLYGHILGGYAGHSQRLTIQSFSTEALAGVLFSPSRGLFIFSPFLIFGVIAGVISAIRHPTGYAAGCLLAAVAYVFFYAFWRDWGAGFSFGPRLLCDVVPFLMIPLIQSFESIRRNRWLLGIYMVLLALSCLVNVLGAYRGDDGWNGTVYRHQKHYILWQIRDSQWKWTVFGP